METNTQSAEGSAADAEPDGLDTTYPTAYDHTRETLSHVPEQGVSPEDKQHFLEQWRGVMPGGIAAWDGLPPAEAVPERKPGKAAA